MGKTRILAQKPRAGIALEFEFTTNQLSVSVLYLTHNLVDGRRNNTSDIEARVRPNLQQAYSALIFLSVVFLLSLTNYETI